MRFALERLIASRVVLDLDGIDKRPPASDAPMLVMSANASARNPDIEQLAVDVGAQIDPVVRVPRRAARRPALSRLRPLAIVRAPSLGLPNRLEPAQANDTRTRRERAVATVRLLRFLERSERPDRLLEALAVL